MVFIFRVLLCLILLVSNLFAQEVSELKHILVDIRGSRHGHGDVSAGYLTALDLIDNHGFKGEISFVMSETEREIISRILGKDIQSGSSLKKNGINFTFFLPEDISSKNFAPADIVLQMARETGDVTDFQTFAFVNPGEGTNRIPISKNGQIMTYSVYGNTETDKGLIPYSSITTENGIYPVHSAGVGPKENGIYYDPVATELAKKNPEQIKEYLLGQIGEMEDVETAKFLESVLKGEVLPGTSVSLAYGISVPETKDQFSEYLRAISLDIEKQGKPVNIITPSGFYEDDIPDDLVDKVVVVDPLDPPKVVDPKKIYISRVPTLPHPVFTGLLGYSQIPPIIAGDGALGAAVTFGRPFAMTSVLWNEDNIEYFGDRFLLKANDREQLRILNAVFPNAGHLPDLSRVVELNGAEFKNLFQQVSAEVPSIASSIVESRSAILNFKSNITFDATRIRDPALRRRIITDQIKAVGLDKIATVSGSQEAIRLVIDEMMNGVVFDALTEDIVFATPIGQEIYVKNLASAIEQGDSWRLLGLSEQLMFVEKENFEKMWPTAFEEILNAIEKAPEESLTESMASMKGLFPELNENQILRLEELLEKRNAKTSKGLLYLFARPDSQQAKNFVGAYLSGSMIEAPGAKFPDLEYTDFFDHVKNANFNQVYLAAQASQTVARLQNLPETEKVKVIAFEEALFSEVGGFDNKALETFLYNRPTRERVVSSMARPNFAVGGEKLVKFETAVLNTGMLDDVGMDLHFEMIKRFCKDARVRELGNLKSPVFSSPKFLELLDYIKSDLPLSQADAVLFQLLKESEDLKDYLSRSGRVSDILFEELQRVIESKPHFKKTLINEFPIDQLSAQNQIKFLRSYLEVAEKSDYDVIHIKSALRRIFRSGLIKGESKEFLESILKGENSEFSQKVVRAEIVELYIGLPDADPSLVEAYAETLDPHSKIEILRDFKNNMVDNVVHYLKGFGLCL